MSRFARERQGKPFKFYLTVKALILLVVLFLLLSFAFLLGSGFSLKKRTSLSNYLGSENNLKVTGVIIKKEKILTAPIGGQIKILKENGAKVNPGELIAILNNEELKNAALDGIKQRNLECMYMIEQINKQLYSNNQEITVLNKRINHCLEQLNLLVQQKNFERIDFLEDKLNQLVFKKYQFINKNADLTGQIEDSKQKLIEDSKELDIYLERAYWRLKSVDSGIIVWSSDSWEDKITPYCFESLNSGFLHSVTPQSSQLLSSGDQVEANQVLGKIVAEAPLFAAVAVPKKISKSFYEGMEVNFNLLDYPDLDCYTAQIVWISQQQSESVLIMKLASFPKLLIEQRLVPLKIFVKK